MDTLPKAIALGWGELYLTVPEFRQAFRSMMSAVDRLPQHLLDRGRCLDFPPLHNACIQGDLAMVEALLKAGIDPDAYPFTENETDETPLIWLTMADGLDSATKTSVAALLLRYGADLKEGDILSFASQCEDQAFAAYLNQSAAPDLK